jgi:hypothetical protein
MKLGNFFIKKQSYAICNFGNGLGILVGALSFKVGQNVLGASSQPWIE